MIDLKEIKNGGKGETRMNSRSKLCPALGVIRKNKFFSKYMFNKMNVKKQFLVLKLLSRSSGRGVSLVTPASVGFLYDCQRPT